MIPGITPVARRVMALLVGLHCQERKRIDRERIAAAVHWSVRTVRRALAELESHRWITFQHGGNGISGFIKVINDMDWEKPTGPVIKVKNIGGGESLQEFARAPSKRLRFEIFRRDAFTCIYCGRKAPNVELVVDHYIPFSKGGRTVRENLVTSCFHCNAGKADVLL